MWSADSASTIAPRCSAHESPLRSHQKCTPLREPPPGEAPAGGEGLATVGSGNARSRNPRAYERMAHPQQRKGKHPYL
jgi:hypothetical protein